MSGQRAVSDAATSAQGVELDRQAAGAAAAPLSALTRDFLVWIASGPRSYDEVMEAWRTSCPRLSIWEDALADGLVQVECPNGRPRHETMVALTARGRAVLTADRCGSEGPDA
jgi:hypothetical protein